MTSPAELLKLLDELEILNKACAQRHLSDAAVAYVAFAKALRNAYPTLSAALREAIKEKK